MSQENHYTRIPSHYDLGQSLRQEKCRHCDWKPLPLIVTLFTQSPAPFPPFLKSSADQITEDDSAFGGQVEQLRDCVDEKSGPCRVAPPEVDEWKWNTQKEIPPMR